MKVHIAWARCSTASYGLCSAVLHPPAPPSPSQDRVFPHGDFDSFICAMERLSGTKAMHHEMHQARMRVLEVGGPWWRGGMDAVVSEFVLCGCVVVVGRVD